MRPQTEPLQDISAPRGSGWKKTPLGQQNLYPDLPEWKVLTGELLGFLVAVLGYISSPTPSGSQAFALYLIRQASWTLV